MDLQGKINQANGRLKSANLGVAIEQINNRLYLRATLPPKPNSLKSEPYQQRISLGIYANGAGLQNAEKEARKLGDALAFGSFKWDDYLAKKSDRILINDLIDNFEKDYFSRRSRNEKSEYTYRHDYYLVFQKLPLDDVLNGEILLKCLLETKPDSRSRKRYFIALNALAKFANIEIDLSRYQGNYSPKLVAPRDLPDDSEIVRIFHNIKNPQWQWVYGMIATFGLRPHEVFHSDTNSNFPILEILKGKTNYRKVWALFPEWVDQFDLTNFKMPNCTGSNTDLGHRVTVAFTRQKIPFAPYNLRHKWAVRAVEFGLDVSLAAAQMGHSVKIHCETYQRWIGEDVHQRAYDLIINNPHRPVAP